MFWERKHQVSEAQLSAYIDGSIEQVEHTHVEAHVGSCASCRATVDELRLVRRALRELPRAVAPRSFALRQSDVAPAPPSVARGMTAAMPALTGVTMAAFLTFGVLIGMDMNDPGGNSADGRSSALQPAPQAAEGATMDRSATEYDAADATQIPDGYAGDVAAGSETMLNALRLTATAGALSIGTPFSTPTPASAALSDGGGSMAIRVGEIAAASVGLVAGGSLAAAWWRRKT
ncbi:MAG: zf-HC2 domain-containing protein [Dehalococcoidia bacterium]